MVVKYVTVFVINEEYIDWKLRRKIKYILFI